MKSLASRFLGMTLAFLCLLCVSVTAQAKEVRIQKGVYADDMELSGMTAEEARETIENYINSLQPVSISLLVVGDKSVEVTAGDLGVSWANPELIEEALALGNTGNIIQRYKAKKDLEHDKVVLPVRLTADLQKVNDVLVQRCAKYDQKPVNYSLTRENGTFQITEGQVGYQIDVETSIDVVEDYISAKWDRKPGEIALDVAVTYPLGNETELAQITDVIGTFTTSYKTSGSSRRANVENGCRLINGKTLYPGDEFSMIDTVTPFSTANGYYPAGSYLNGKVVDSLGGGICQVSTTLYNAVLKAELEVTERHNHSMIVSYVDPSADAAIAEGAGKDFRFKNNYDFPIYIEGITKDRQITFTIYGKETRPSNRKVTYESEVVEKTEPPADIIYPDASKPIGYIVADSAHIGYKANLWKIVTEDGKQISRTQVNSSKYKMVPRSATVGTATSNPSDYEEIMAAIGTGSVSHVKNVIAILTSKAATNSQEIGDQ